MATFQRILVALVGAVLIVVMSVSMVLAATGVGAAIQLGVVNTVGAMTQLIATTSNAALKIQNKGTGPGITITVGDGESPITVSASAGKATNLDADKVDGKDASAFQSKITNLDQLTNVACSGDGLSKVLINGPRGLVDCASPDTEPNDNLNTALNFVNPYSYGSAGGPDDDFWTVPSQCTASFCDVQVTIFSDSLTMDLYVNSSVQQTNQTSINYQDASHTLGNPGTYKIRIHGPKKRPYGLSSS